MTLATNPAQFAAPAQQSGSGRPRRSWVRSLLDLTKARITIATTLVTGAGYVMFTGAFVVEALVPMLGVFLLACGSAGLNQVQEWRTDKLMKRTRQRPIPSGEMSPTRALVISVAFIFLGLNVLAAVERNTLLVVGLGVLALVWYNGFYLYMKRRTQFAAVPGALIGAIPPVLGWCAAGGPIFSPQILDVAFFFFIWQIPHFWLLVQIYGGEYEDAGLPMPTRSLNAVQFRNLTSVWILAVVVTGMVLAVTQRFGVPWNVLALVGSIWLAAATVIRIQRPGRFVALALFKRINIYAFGMCALVIANACVRF